MSKGEKDRSKEDKETEVVGLKFPMDFCPKNLSFKRVDLVSSGKIF